MAVRTERIASGARGQRRWQRGCRRCGAALEGSVAGWQSAAVIRAGACGLALLAVVIAGIVTADALRFTGRPWAGFGMLPDGSVAPLALSPVPISAESHRPKCPDRIVSVRDVA